jgi:hypothetical protein
MELEQIIGIVVIKCQCGAKFVVNTDTIKEGVLVHCDKSTGGCGAQWSIPRWSSATMSIRPCTYEYIQWTKDKKMMREYEKPYTDNQAVPLAVYKSMLSDWILNGKSPKIPKQHKKVVRFPEFNEEQLQNTVDTLISIGFGRTDALARVEIALEQGFRHENDILRAIMTL